MVNELENLIGGNEVPQAVPTPEQQKQVDVVVQIEMALNALDYRLAMLEQLVTYLASKDPEMGPKLKAIAEAAEAEAKKRAESANVPEATT